MMTTANRFIVVCLGLIGIFAGCHQSVKEPPEVLSDQIEQVYDLVSSYPDSALRLAEGLEAQAIAAKDPKSEAHALYVQARAYWELKSIEKSLLLHQAAREIRETIQDSVGLGRSYNNLGLLSRTAGQDSLALDLFQKSYQYRKATGDSLGLVYSAINIGQVYHKQGQTDLATAFLKEAQQLAVQLDQPAASAFVAFHMAKVCEQKGDWSGAEAGYERAYRVYQENGFHKDALESNLHLAMVRVHLPAYSGNPKACIRQAEQMLAEAKQQDWKNLESSLQYFLSILYRADNRPDDAYEALNAHFKLDKSLEQGEHLLMSRTLKGMYDWDLRGADMRINRAMEESSEWKTWLLASIGLILLGMALGILLIRKYWSMKQEKSQLEFDHILSKQKNSDLIQFSETISHDFREPLRSFIFSLELLRMKEGVQIPPVLQQELDDAKKRIQDLNLMLADLEAYSGVTRQKITFEPVDLNEKFRRIERDLAARIKETGAIITFDEFPVITSQRTLLYQVLVNLISNSLKFHKPGEAPRIEVTWKANQETISIFVRDYGVGISENDQEKIFEEFGRGTLAEEVSGRGLGLAIASRAVKLLGGDIRVASVEGKGTTFVVDLPVVSPVVAV